MSIFDRLFRNSSPLFSVGMWLTGAPAVTPRPQLVVRWRPSTHQVAVAAVDWVGGTVEHSRINWSLLSLSLYDIIVNFFFKKLKTVTHQTHISPAPHLFHRHVSGSRAPAPNGQVGVENSCGAESGPSHLRRWASVSWAGAVMTSTGPVEQRVGVWSSHAICFEPSGQPYPTQKFSELVCWTPDVGIQMETAVKGHIFRQSHLRHWTNERRSATVTSDNASRIKRITKHVFRSGHGKHMATESNLCICLPCENILNMNEYGLNYHDHQQHHHHVWAFSTAMCLLPECRWSGMVTLDITVGGTLFFWAPKHIQHHTLRTQVIPITNNNI